MQRLAFLMMGTVVVGVTLLGTSPAWAFCRATDCNPAEDICTTDEQGCLVDGVPLGWMPGKDVTFAVDADSADASAVGEDDASRAVESATLAWAGAFCDGETSPNLVIREIEGASDAKVTVLFRNDEWPYEERAVARTTLTFDKDSGEISGATVELNSFSYPFARVPEPGDVDLVAVLTHEFGHVIGLDHSQVQGATMESESSSAWAPELRSLDQDDVDGLCSLYPPQAEEPPSYDVGNDVHVKDDDSGGCSTGARGYEPHLPATSAFSGLVLAACFVLLARRRHARA